MGLFRPKTYYFYSFLGSVYFAVNDKSIAGTILPLAEPN